MKRFHFELDALLDKFAWDVDILRTEKASASLAVEAQQKELRSLEEQIRECHDSLLKISGEDAEISIAQRQVLGNYLRYKLDLSKTACVSLEKAQAIEQQIVEQLLDTSQRLKTVEKLKEHGKLKHDYLRMRAESNESDENWLTRRNHT